MKREGRRDERLKIDLHVHSRLSKSFEYDAANLERLVRLGRRRGLDGFVLTEHIHAVNFWDMHERLNSDFEYDDGAYQVADDFAVFSGAELTVAERVDFIVFGPLDQLRSLDNAFRPRLSAWNHAPALEVAEAVRERDLVLVLAHPFRVGKEAAKLDERVFPLFHAIEVNGRDHGGERAVVALAENKGKPLSGGSDAHFYLQVGIRSTIVPPGDMTLRSRPRVDRSWADARTRQGVCTARRRDLPGSEARCQVAGRDSLPRPWRSVLPARKREYGFERARRRSCDSRDSQSPRKPRNTWSQLPRASANGRCCSSPGDTSLSVEVADDVKVRDLRID